MGSRAVDSSERGGFCRPLRSYTAHSAFTLYCGGMPNSAAEYALGPCVLGKRIESEQKMTAPKDEKTSFGKTVCIAIGAVIGIAILKALGIGGAIGGGLGALLGAVVGGFVYSLLFERK